MREQTARTRMVKAATLGLLTVGIASIAVIGIAWTRQARRMRLAEQHLPVVREALGQLREFESIRVGVYTGQGGALMVTGLVHTSESLARLKRLVAATNPPIDVYCTVQVLKE
jgi:hypothetical protein